MADDKQTLCILGCGFMGTALLKGVLSSTSQAENRVRHFNAAVQRPESAQRVSEAFSTSAEIVEVFCGENVKAVESANTVILGFQPSDVDKVLGTSEIRKALAGKLIISMLAGVSCAAIQLALDMQQTTGDTTQDQKHTRIIRVVPSIGAQINESASLVSDSPVSESDIDFVRWFFGRVGTTEVLPEELINAAVAVSATCHALVVTAVDSITDGSVSRGLPRPITLKIIGQCLRGASSLLLDQMTVEELKASMSVPRGITTEAWIELEEGNVRKALSQTVRRAVDYAEKMV